MAGKSGMLLIVEIVLLSFRLLYHFCKDTYRLMGIFSLGSTTNRGLRVSYHRGDASIPTPPHPTPAPTRGHSHSPLIFGRTPSLDLIDEGIYGLSQIRPPFSLRPPPSAAPQI